MLAREKEDRDRQRQVVKKIRAMAGSASQVQNSSGDVPEGNPDDKHQKASDPPEAKAARVRCIDVSCKA